MPEGVLEIGEEPLLVEELAGLEAADPGGQLFRRRVDDRLQQR